LNSWKAACDRAGKTYNGRCVVDKVNLEVRRGEVVGLLGPNGAGKTTTFYIIVGLTLPDDGSVMLNGEDISQFPMYMRARRGINYLPQEPSVFRRLTVEENIMAILETLDINKEEREERLCGLLEELDLTGLARNYGIFPFRWRTQEGGDYKGACHIAAVHVARRALCRN